MNLMMLLEMASSADPDRIAIGDKVGGMSSGQLFELAGRATTWFAGMGIERVLYADVTSPMLPVALFGASWAGMPFVPVSYRLADDRLRSLVGRQAPAVILVGAGTEARFAGIEGITVVTTDAMTEKLAKPEAPGAESEVAARPEWSFDPEDPAVLLHTSGTSGEPKVAVLRQKHLVSYVIGTIDFLGADPDEATLVSVPPYHIAGVAAMLTALYSGRRLVQMPAFDEANWVAVAREQAITHAMLVPTMLGRMLDVIEADSEGLPALRLLSYGGGRMPLPVIERAMRLLPNVDFVNAYGLTETSSSVAVLGPQDHRDAMSSDDPEVRARLGSVGQPLPTVEISIRDPLGEPSPVGESGEVWVRGEQVSGQYSGRDATQGGWFPTSDAGFFDSGGFLYVTGRIDDVIVRGGENLSPGEIEDVLLRHEGIRDAVVLGLPDDEWGEIVAAVIVRNDDSDVDADAVRTWVASQLRSTRTPAVVEFRTELPQTDTGKVLRRVLRTELSE